VIRPAWALGLAAALSCAAPSARPERPSILVFLADDLGYGDVGCYGAPDVRTPHLDRLAAEGVRFTQFYSNGPECTPTRAALLTGRYQHRVGGLECAIGIGGVGRYDDAIRLAERRELGLPPEEPSIARVLQEAGYETALCGKWHLGYERKFLPDRHGFEYSFGLLGGSVDYFHHCEPDGTPTLYENGAPVKRDGYMTDLIADAAVRFLRRPRGKPFFLYVPFNAPHSPYQGPRDRKEKPLAPAEWNTGTRAKFAEMVEHMDLGIGKILAALEETGQARNTLVVFTSDNGGDPRGRNLPLSGQKGGLYEGGIRVPCIVRWPGVLHAGTVRERPGITLDLTATFLRVAGARPPRPPDGQDLFGADGTGRTLFWRARRGATTWKAVRDGTLKYLSRQDGAKFEEHLFDLAADPGEKKDLISERGPDKDRLKALLARWESEVRPSR
jgi:N-acetylgalactosamine-6-sulfatase